MVIGKRFAWAHLAKTGGDATAAMFALVPGLVEFADPPDVNDKHAPFSQREAAIKGRLLVMNIRRLPAWTLSLAHHRARHGKRPDFTPIPLPSSDAMVETSYPDQALRWMTAGPWFPIDRWLRTEHLFGDVDALLAELGQSSWARRKIKRVPWIGKDYDHDLANRFTPAQIERLYELNPDWAEVERRVYGGLYQLSTSTDRPE